MKNLIFSSQKKELLENQDQQKIKVIQHQRFDIGSVDKADTPSAGKLLFGAEKSNQDGHSFGKLQTKKISNFNSSGSVQDSKNEIIEVTSTPKNSNTNPNDSNMYKDTPMFQKNSEKIDLQKTSEKSQNDQELSDNVPSHIHTLIKG